MVLVMGIAWAMQRRLRNAGWIDVFWTFGTGTACVVAALWPGSAANPARQVLVAGLAGLWALRLGSYLALRVARSEEDQRYAELRREWGAHFQPRLLRFVMWQPPVTGLLALSVFAAAHAPGRLDLRDAAGLTVLVLALVGEAIADLQMKRYKARENRPPVLDSGLWSLSRHPNYFCEWLAWLAYPIIAFSPYSIFGWATIAAPMVMYLVLRYGTGVPMLEASLLRRKGKAFSDYQARIGAFFPSWPHGPRRTSKSNTS